MDQRNEHTLLAEYLRKRDQKMTGPRETVLEVFLGIEHHITAEALWEEVRRVDPKIGQATVFRTIKLFAEAGIAREACKDDGTRSFEHAYRHKHHDHLVCVDCGAIVEFTDDLIEASQAAIYKRHGFEATGHCFELFGHCPACLRKRKKSL